MYLYYNTYINSLLKSSWVVRTTTRIFASLVCVVILSNPQVEEYNCARTPIFNNHGDGIVHPSPRAIRYNDWLPGKVIQENLKGIVFP